MSRLLLLLISLLMISTVNKADAQGLRFHGNEMDIADRSALTIPSPDDSASPVNRISVKFSIHVNNISSPGFIFGITNRRTGEMLNLMLRNSFTCDSVYIYFAKEGERELCSSSFHKGDISTRNIDVEVSIEKDSDSGVVAIDGKRFPVSNLGVSRGDFTPQLNFGLTRHIVETASVTLFGLGITSDGVLQEIPLNESDGTLVHDAAGNVAGRVFNPRWQINEAFHWKRIARFKSPSPTGCAFDPIYSTFYSYNCDSITKFNANTLNISKSAIKGDSKLPVRHGMNFYSGKTGKIYSYEIYYDDFSGEIDPENGEWKLLAHTADNKAIHHHAHLLCRNDSSAWIFGGYGDRMYFNKFVKFNLHTHSFDTIPLKGDVIPPRFFASMGASASGDTIYLYGGKGNHEGKQDLGVKYYYDLYAVNLKDSTSRLLWRQAAPDKDRVPARTLLTDAANGYLYAMVYPEYRTHSSLQLYRISLADGSETAVGNSIPLVSEEIATNVALYRPTGGDRIFCVVQEFEKEGATTTSIYSIAAPPVSEDELILSTSQKSDSPRPVLAIVAIVSAAIAAVAAVLYRRRRKRSQSPDSEPTQPVAAPADEAEDNDNSTHTNHSAPQPYKLTPLPELPAANRISLLGAFTAIGSDGVDISHLFSPKLKVIFIYMLMGTLKKGGVSTDELNSVFWPDKEQNKIKNLRNVTIAKLRKILTEFRGIGIVYDNGRFSITVDDSCFCDIHRLYRLTDNLSDLAPGDDNMPEVRAIIAQGKFLPAVETPELDVYKSEVETYSLDLLLSMLDKYTDTQLWDEAARCSQMALRIDPLCEKAMRLGVRAYAAAGNKSRARNMYDKFSATWSKTYSHDYAESFLDLVKTC